MCRSSACTTSAGRGGRVPPAAAGAGRLRCGLAHPAQAAGQPHRARRALYAASGLAADLPPLAYCAGGRGDAGRAGAAAYTSLVKFWLYNLALSLDHYRYGLPRRACSRPTQQPEDRGPDRTGRHALHLPGGLSGGEEPLPPRLAAAVRPGRGGRRWGAGAGAGTVTSSSSTTRRIRQRVADTPRSW